ncbi:DKNYY domain-containing protein [Fulvivirga ulvae]|uniref:DKNYY domain-containing protein n=1 Tax=Fulvivirga ulvae TaxID=2904245 RepID=UPI001F1D4B46|nr:DKNYY domain-containing protein [Fulvivirga ulvae]UII33526.1 DKNYY domain-containing protein [Fulvivirga ulvae]
MYYLTTYPYLSAIILALVVNLIFKKVFMLKNSPLSYLLIFIFSAIGQACSPFAGPVDKEKSDSYYYSKLKREIRYSPMGNWFALGNSKVDSADVSSFEVIDRDFGKDKDHIFYQDHIIDGEVDRETFKVKEFLCFDKNGVYLPVRYIADDLREKVPDGRYMFAIVEANPKTFVKLDQDWSKDDASYFYNYQKVDVDYQTFEVINGHFAKDKNKVYLLKSFSIRESAIDPATAQKVDERYIVDKDSIYDFQQYLNGVEVDSLVSFKCYDSNSINFLGENFLLFDDKVVYDGVELPGVDSRSFRVVKNYYSKDKNRVYCGNRVIDGADPESFEVFEHMFYSKDKYNVYGDGIVIKEADAETFEPVNTDKSVLYKDKNHTYQWGKITDEKI